jgi:hypothetical protein
MSKSNIYNPSKERINELYRLCPLTDALVNRETRTCVMPFDTIEIYGHKYCEINIRLKLITGLDMEYVTDQQYRDLVAQHRAIL